MALAIREIQFSEQSIEMFTSQINQFGVTETGGVLMGYLEHGKLFIAKASDPGPKAIHEPEYFRADANYVDMFIDVEAANSGGKLRYVGEWHTHPQTQPWPSDTDFQSLSEISDSAEEFVVMLIVGAIKYTKERFAKRHIAIVKFKDDSNFYKL